MKIVQVITGLGIGGAEKQVCLLAEQLAEKKHDVTIISLVGESLNMPVNNDIDIVEIRMKKNIIGFIMALYKVTLYFCRLKPDIIHSHMFHANIIARLASFLSFNSRYLICTAHNKNEGGRIRMFFYRLTDFMCVKTTNVSQEALDTFIYLKAFKSTKSEVVYNGLDFQKFQFSANSRNKIRKELGVSHHIKLILSVGRLTEAKDYPNLFKAIKILKENNFILVIVGDGHLKKSLNNLLSNLGLESEVIFVGIRNDVHAFYSAADLFVLPSRWEGFGLVVAEAMGASCPVVATDSGGVAEVVGCNDYLVPTDNPHELAHKMDYIMSFIGYDRKIMVNKNRAHVTDNFSIEKVIAKWLGIYNEKARK